ncbi:MAG: alpha/beta hydrolase [Polyangiales bacterium]
MLLTACGDDDDRELVDSGAPVGDASVPRDAGDTRPLDASVVPLDGAQAPGDAATREHDERIFTVDAAALPFMPLTAVTAETDRWSGVLDGAAYRIEVPRNWNGTLVMYAHGFRGQVPALSVSNPSIRRRLIEGGYAWAASSYAANYYDVRAGVEDTNKLALAFTRIAKENGRTLDEPSKRYIIGHSMGGHVTGAAIEAETARTARNKVRYDAALPMCGVLGDVELFNYYAGFQAASFHFAKVTAPTTPVADFTPIRTQLINALFTTYPSAPTASGQSFRDVIRNLTGGARPLFEQGFALESSWASVWTTYNQDGTVNGVLAQPISRTVDVDYQLDADPAVSAEERTLNQEIARVDGKPELANPLRSDGLRWVPLVQGEFDVPVLTLHTLGDLFVPFSMEQYYRQRAVAKGNGERLVQRAIRGSSHCEFTVQEQIEAFDALVRWEREGVKPAGDEVLDRAVLANDSYGCTFTRNTTGPDDAPTLSAARAAAPPCP